jgi:hypothetical protein
MSDPTDYDAIELEAILGKGGVIVTVSVNELAKTMLEAYKQGYQGDAFHEVVRTQCPRAFLRDYNEAADLAWQWFREEVAQFASWKMGCCHGDESPECYRAWRDVMEHDFRFGVEAKQYCDSLKSLREPDEYAEQISV